jgi:hypothetical protein
MVQPLDAADAVFLRVGLHHLAVGIHPLRRQDLVLDAVEIEHRSFLQLRGRKGRLEYLVHEGHEPALASRPEPETLDHHPLALGRYA